MEATADIERQSRASSSLTPAPDYDHLNDPNWSTAADGGPNFVQTPSTDITLENTAYGESSLHSIEKIDSVALSPVSDKDYQYDEYAPIPAFMST